MTGTSIFLHPVEDAVPPALLHNLKHNQVLHEQVLILTIRTEKKPFVNEQERLVVKKIGNGFWKCVMSFGFREPPDIPRALRRHAKSNGLSIDRMRVSS